MSVKQSLAHELKALTLATLFFGVWIGALILLKTLVLEEYHVRFHKFSLVLIGALTLSKVVVVLEPVPLGNWVRRHPAFVDLLSRTALYALGVFAVMLLEKAIEARHEAGGFAHALATIFQHPDMPHLWANLLCMGGALLTYNFLTLLRRHLGPAGLRRVLFSPPD